MSLFFKDPKSCMSPWRGLCIIVIVCGFVMVSLLAVKRRHEASLAQDRAGGRAAPARTGVSGPGAVVSDNVLNF